MEDIEYCAPKKKEWIDMVYVVLALSFMFAFSFVRFNDNTSTTFAQAFVTFFAFLAVLFISRQIFMKFYALQNGFEIRFNQSIFNRYGFASYDTLSYWAHEAEKKTYGVGLDVYGKVKKKPDGPLYKYHKLEGIGASIISLFIYLLTLGFIIYPNMWSYRFKTIPHRFIGTQKRYEVHQRTFLFNIEVTDYRKSLIYMAGFIYYFIFGYLLKFFLEGSGEFYFWLVFALYWIALITLIPIPGSEGFEFWKKNTLAWILTLTILITGMISLLVLKSFWYVILSVLLAFLIALCTRIWRSLMKKESFGEKGDWRHPKRY